MLCSNVAGRVEEGAARNLGLQVVDGGVCVNPLHICIDDAATIAATSAVLEVISRLLFVDEWVLKLQFAFCCSMS